MGAMAVKTMVAAPVSRVRMETVTRRRRAARSEAEANSRCRRRVVWRGIKDEEASVTCEVRDQARIA